MKTINYLALLLGILLAPTQVFGQYNAVQEIAPDAVSKVLTEGALFVDVRETNEVEVLAYDLPDLINLPLSELPGRLAELPRNQPIIVAGRSGTRSQKAAALLLENDFTQVFNLTGGIIAWEAAALPVVKTKRTTGTTATGKMGCSGSAQSMSCGSKKTGETEKACCAKKGEEQAAKASCGGGGGKKAGKSCCAGGSN